MELREAVAGCREELVASLQKCISVNSVYAEDGSGYPYGSGVQTCLQETLALAERLGLSTCELDHQVGWCEYGEGPEMVAVLGHLDVVPAGDGWTVPPFEGRVTDGKLYGRGAVDDKGPSIAAIYALKAIRDCGIPLRRRIRILLGTNEETGSADMKYYLKHGGETPVMGFTPDGEYPVINGEKGIINVTFSRDYRQEGALRLLRIVGGTAPNVVPSHAFAEFSCENGEIYRRCLPDSVTYRETEQGFCVEAEGVSAHGSTPEQGVNAIGKLLIALKALELQGALGDAVRFLAEKIGLESDGEHLGIALQDEVSGKLTFNLGVLQADENRLSLRINYRYPVTYSYEDCAPALKAAFSAAGFSLDAETHKSKLYVPEDSVLVRTLLNVYERETGTPATAKSIGGGTYAKSVPNIVAFGPIFPGEPVREHKPDEYIELDRLMQNAQIIAQAMVELAK